MSEQTAISWCDSTFNPWIGCTKVSPACDHCYAARQDAFRKWTPEGWGGPRRRTSAALWEQPGKWNEQPFCECAGCGWRGPDRATITIDNPPGFHPPVAWARGCPACRQPTVRTARRRVFCASLADVFDNQVPPEWRAELFALIAATPNLDWLLLTKRIGNVGKMIEAPGMQKCGLPPNVWLGATICNQEEADRDIPNLLAVPARVRFLSIEPMLGSIRLYDDWIYGVEWQGPGPIDWIICGGESGPQARPFVLGHAKEIVRQCKAAGVAVHVKQLGARPVNREGVPHQISDKAGGIVSEWPEELRVQEFPT